MGVATIPTNHPYPTTMAMSRDLMVITAAMGATMVITDIMVIMATTATVACSFRSVFERQGSYAG